MIYTIPLRSIASQRLTCAIAGVSCHIWLRQLAGGLYIDITLDNAPLLNGALCQNKVDLIRSPASLLSGAFYFCDLQGQMDPNFTGLGGRFQLYYEDHLS